MKKSRKRLLAILMLVCMLMVTGCGDIENLIPQETTEHETEEAQKKEYTVLDVREQAIGLGYSSYYYIVSVVLEDETGERFYYDYESLEEKDDKYVDIAGSIPGDIVTYIDGDIKRK